MNHWLRGQIRGNPDESKCRDLEIEAGTIVAVEVVW